jgi:dihydroorotate dehydrogenase
MYRNDPKQLHFDAISSTGPVIRLLDPETAHMVGIWAAKAGLFPKETRPDPPSLTTTVWGREFSNPLGIAAGFDKNAEIIDQLLGLGFGFVEIGSVTPLPQPGNSKPRCFRLPEHKAVINRYGFNSDGFDAVKERIIQFRQRQKTLQEKGQRIGMLGINLGKNKLSQDAVADYRAGIQAFAPLADYLVINISSPNTPGLRALQSRSELETLVTAIKKARDDLSWDKRVTVAAGPPPLLVKIAPDLTEDDKKDIAAVVLKLKVDGLIVSNTTVERPGPIASHRHGNEAGGLSGPPLFDASTRVLHEMYALTKGKIPIIGVGGIATGKDAYLKIRAGASLVEAYTAFSYQGPSFVPKVKRELAECLRRDGFSSVAEAVGADHKEW